MINAGTVSATISDTLSRLVARFPSHGARPARRDRADDLATAFAAFAADKPAWVGTLFDEEFLRRDGFAIVADFRTGVRSRHAAAIALAQAWNQAAEPIPSHMRKRRVADVVMIGDSFLASLVTSVPTAPPLLVRTADVTGRPVIAPTGALDRSSFATVIAEAAALRAAGHDAVTVDLTYVTALDLCGLYALHAVAALYLNLASPDAFSGDAGTLRSLRRLAEANLAHGRSASVRLTGLCPALQAKVAQAGLDQVFTLAHA